MPAIDRMTGVQFEDKVVQLCEQDGFIDVVRVGGAGDRGVDVIATHPDGRHTIIQCKRYTVGRKVSDPEMRNFVGALRLHRPEPDLAVLVTSSGFTAPALVTARDQQIITLDRNQFAVWLRGVSLRTRIESTEYYRRRRGE